jgi:hypothetical protein
MIYWPTKVMQIWPRNLSGRDQTLPRLVTCGVTEEYRIAVQKGVKAWADFVVKA